MKLNFGCGRKKLKGWINIDIERQNEPDVVIDMNKFPFPFKNEAANEIYCSMTLEHVERPFTAISEFHRILKKGGKVHIFVPHVSSYGSLKGEEHIRVFWSTDFYAYADRQGLFGVSAEAWKDEYPLFSDVYVKLIFPKNKLKLVSLPFDFLFGEGRYAQAFYEQFLSSFYRCADIEAVMIK